MAELNFGELAQTIRNTVDRAQIMQDAKNKTYGVVVPPNASDPNVVDKPINRDRSYPTRSMVVEESEEAAEPAFNGTLFAEGRRILTPEQFDDFVIKKQPFQQMLVEWSLEDDPTKRKQIFDSYENTNNFSNNEVYNEIINGLEVWEQEEESSKKNKKNTSLVPNILQRANFMNQMQRNLNDIEKRQRSLIYNKA